MGETIGISWWDSTFNSWWGCFPVSPGCALCYAKRQADLYGHTGHWEKDGPRRTFGEAHWQEPRKWAKKLPTQLGRRPRVFTASMADIGDAHPVCEQERPKLWRLIEETPELDWLLLTKRVDTAHLWLPERWMNDGLPPQAWFGFSAEDQERFNERWPHAARIPARIRFCSYEPALGPVDFSAALANGVAPVGEIGRPGIVAFDVAPPALHWVIAGGESGGRLVRPSHPDWFRSARDQCAAAGVAFLFKQRGEWSWNDADEESELEVPLNWRKHPERYRCIGLDGKPRTFYGGEGEEFVVRVGKKRAGNLLDSRQHLEFPQSAVAA